MQAALLTGKQKESEELRDLVLMDVIPLSLGIAVGSDAMMSVLLKVRGWGGKRGSVG